VAAWCDSLLVMAKGGNVAYHGPVAQATSHFNVKHLSEIYQKLGKPNTENWGALHASKSPYYERVRNSSASDANGASAASKTPTRAAEQKVSLSQLNVLVERYLDIVRADKATLLMAAIQSIVIGAVLRIMFGG